jgi:two-component SAPR family response regulator
VRIDGRLVSAKKWGSQTAREMFIYLLLQRDGVRRDQLLAAIAPDSSPARASSQFHVSAYRIRQALYKGCVRFDGDVYQIDPRLEYEFDVDDFRAACRAAKGAATGTSAEVAALERAATFYGGPFLEGCYAEWALMERSSLEEEYISVVSRLARLNLVRGDLDAAHSVAQRGLAVDNSLEELHDIALRALVSSGQLAEAHRHLNAYAAYLREELGEPVPAALTCLLQAAQGGRHLAAVV